MQSRKKVENERVSENSSDVPKDLFGIGLEGMFNPRHISEEDVIPEPPGTWVPNPDAWTWMADLKPGSLRFPGGESGKFMHLLPYRDLDIDGFLTLSRAMDMILKK